MEGKPKVSRREMISAGMATVAGLSTLPAASARSDSSGGMWRSTYGMETPRKQFAKEEQVFPLRFVTYLTRFLLNYDAKSSKFWEQAGANIPLSYTSEQVREMRLRQYGDFAASVELGLKPFESKEGIIALTTALSNTFTSNSAKRQLSILFSFLTNDDQPVSYIESLIAEADNATVSQITVTDAGSGYLRPPAVRISSPIGRSGATATAKAAMEATGPIGVINVTAGGTGYSDDVVVEISPPSSQDGRQAKAVAEVVNGTVTKISITNPGTGYNYDKPPVVTIVDNYGIGSGAKVKAILELKVSQISIVNPGCAYGAEQSITVDIDSPQESMGMDSGTKATATATLKMPKGISGLSKKLSPQSISEELTQLIPDSVVPSYDSEQKRYSVEVPIEGVRGAGLLSTVSRCGGALDPVFGPRGCSPVEREKQLDLETYSKFAFSGAACAAISHAVLTPLEVVKTKIQNDPSSDLGVVVQDTFSQGPQALFRGIGPTAAGFFVGGSMSFGLTEFFRRLFAENAGPSNAELYQVPIVISASILAVIFACIGVVPFEAVRIKLQSDNNVEGGFAGGFMKIKEESGLLGFYEGLNAILFKEIPFALCKFAVFDAACNSIYNLYPAARESLSTALLVSVIGGAISGSVAAVVSHPADTVLTSLYSEESMSTSGATETVDRGDIPAAVRSIVDSDGWTGLFAGVGPRVVFAAVLLALEFLLYDYLKVLLKVSPEDLGQYLDVLSTFK